MGAVRPLAKCAVSGAFPGKQTVKDAETLENMGFPGYGLIPVSFVFEVSTMPYGDCSLSKKLDDGGHRPLNSATRTTSMAVVQARVLRFSRLRIRKEGMQNSRDTGVML